MTDHVRLLDAKLRHLAKLRGYLAYSLSQVQPLLPLQDPQALSQRHHESLAAFRVRFSEFQEHLGKAMRAVAIEEEQSVERFGAVLALMERLGVLDSAERWKELRELRNAVNHEYDEDPQRLADFFSLLVSETPTLLRWHDQLARHCREAYGCEGAPPDA